MTRREFLKHFVNFTVAATAAVSSPGLFVSLFRKLFPPKTNVLTNSQKEAIIAQALNTSEGRMALARSMVEPIRRSLDYQAVGSKLLMVEELPQGALAKYESGVMTAITDLIQKGI